MSWQPLDEIPWIFIYSNGPYAYGHCQVCQMTTEGLSDEQLDAFVDQHTDHQSASTTHMGLGDAFKATMSAIGFTKKCTPCEARRNALNNAFPAVWRRG